MSSLHRVQRVTVEKLFGLYDHRIDLKLHDRVTIIHGPNGVGKTMVLRLLGALFAGRFSEFTRIPLRRFEVSLTDGTSISVEPSIPKRSNKNQRLGHPPLRLAVTTSSGDNHKAELGFGPGHVAETIMLLQTELPWLDRIGDDRWHDGRTGQIVDSAELVARYAEYLPPQLRRPRAMHTEPDWFVPIRTQVNVHFIEAQRLLRLQPQGSGSRRDGSAMVPTVRDHAQELKGRVKDTLARYGSESQALDQSFPQRLLRAASAAALSIDEIKSRMKELDDKRAKLKSIGLLDDDASYPFDTASLDRLDSTQRSVMTLYVDDTAKKLGVLDDLSRRVELLRDNVNGKFSHKQIKIDRERGFFAIGHDGHPLDPDALSSGEQHELVLLYDLLFRVQPNTMVLVDEPELSLHVSWQKRFLPELLEIVKTAEFDALVATHSPFIVGDRSDLMIPLAAEVQ